MFQYIRAHAVKTVVDIRIGITQNGDPQIRQVSIPTLVVFDPVVFKMLGAVKFDNQFCRGAVEVGNILSDDLLPIECYGQISQKIIP